MEAQRARGGGAWLTGENGSNLRMTSCRHSDVENRHKSAANLLFNELLSCFDACKTASADLHSMSDNIHKQKQTFLEHICCVVRVLQCVDSS